MVLKIINKIHAKYTNEQDKHDRLQMSCCRFSFTPQVGMYTRVYIFFSVYIYVMYVYSAAG